MAARRKSSQLPPADEDFIVQMGLHFQRAGAPAIAGQLFGATLLTDRPVSLSQLAKRLGVSKASVSTNVRMVEQGGFLTRTAVHGREHYYEVKEDAWDRYFDVSLRRMHDFTELCAHAASAISPARKHIKDRLLQGVRTMQLLQESFTFAVARTRRRKHNRTTRP